MIGAGAATRQTRSTIINFAPARKVLAWPRRLMGHRTVEGAALRFLGSETMPFVTLSDDEEKELYRLQRFYWREALRCAKAKAYLAGCIMVGSALEALLTLMVNIYPEEAESTGEAPIKGGALKPLLEWNFGDLLRVAKAAHWLPSALRLDDPWNTRKARIGDYAEVVRQVRNLAHPARYALDHHGRRVTRNYLQRQFDVVANCRNWLLERNDRELREHISEEEPAADA